MKSGLGSASTLSRDENLFISIAASAMHTLAKQIILDTSMLVYHQQVAEFLYRNIEELPREELDKIKNQINKIVWQYHILSPNGVGVKLNPIIASMKTQEPLDPDLLRREPVVAEIVQNISKFQNVVQSQSISQVLQQILDLDGITNMTRDEEEKHITDSYSKDEDIAVAVFEDDTVQCSCTFCEKYFSILDELDNINYDQLNPVQRKMVDAMHLLDDLDDDPMDCSE